MLNDFIFSLQIERTSLHVAVIWFEYKVDIAIRMNLRNNYAWLAYILFISIVSKASFGKSKHY